ncbi:hypothetical protein [Hymenobacter sp. IS2118]|uniref:hypothetical protein n=1 Tax=Hymenobacter sp. IS2118 TaxID=1505605 RepID=UPI001269576D|nr:hypothetical protein [Hymenobacter sp. IS2118]
MSAVHSPLTSLLRCFGGGGLLAGLLLAGCARYTPQASTNFPSFSPAHSVSGYVLDAVSKQPLAGIPVARNGAQTSSATDGFFQLNYPAAKQETYLFDKEEELAVELPAYAGRAYIPADTTQRITLPLLRNLYRFPPDGNLRPADSAHVSPCTAPWLGWPSTQRAFLIQDSSIHQPRRLRAITFRIGENGFDREPFRIRLYRYNGPEQPPGEDLLTENYVVSGATKETYTYDLSNANVILPASGFFLALEYMIGGDKFYTSIHMVGYVPVGPLLRPPYAFADTRTWVYTIGKGWQRIPAAQTCWPRYESSVGVEVEPVR